MKQLLECLHQILGNCKHVTELSNCYEYFWGIQGFLIYLVKNVWKIVNSPSFIFLLNYLFNLISFQMKFSTKLALLQYEDTVTVKRYYDPALTLLYSLSHEYDLGNSQKLICIENSQILQFFTSKKIQKYLTYLTF